MAHPSTWLPATLEPVAMRLARADEAVFKIAQLARAWSSEGAGPLKVVGVKHPDDTIVYHVSAIRPIPPLLSLLFSEAINHLRAAIENTLFFLVEEQRGSVLPEDQAKRISMPVYEDEASLNRWFKDNEKKLPELGAESALTSRIRALQPYVDGERVPSISEELAKLMGVTPVREAPLTLLQQYSNHDKHRIPVAAAQRSSIVKAGKPFLGSDHVMNPLHVGDALVSTRAGELGEIETNSAIHIERPTSGVWVAPASELNALRQHVADFVIPTLVTGLALPGSLPPSIELRSYTEQARQRIEEADWTSGKDRATANAFSAVIASLEAEPSYPDIIDVEDYTP